MSPRIDLGTSGTNNLQFCPVPTLPRQSIYSIEAPKQYIQASPSTYRLLENSFLKGLYDLGSWANRNLSSTSAKITEKTIDSTLGYKNAESGHSGNNSSFGSKAIGLLGKTFNAVTGTLEFAKAFNEDVNNGNESLSGTVSASVKSTGQIAAAGIAGSAVAGSIIVAGMPAIAAGAIVAGTGIAAGYLAGQAYDLLKEHLF